MVGSARTFLFLRLMTTIQLSRATKRNRRKMLLECCRKVGLFLETDFRPEVNDLQPLRERTYDYMGGKGT